jgi:hypothetical protein
MVSVAAVILASSIVREARQDTSNRNVFVCYADDRLIKKEDVARLKQNGTKEFVEEFCKTNEQVLVEFMPKTFGVFPTFQRMRNYLDKRKMLFGWLMKDEASKVSVPRQQIKAVEDFGPAFQKELAYQMKDKIGRKVDGTTKFTLVFGIEAFFTSGETSRMYSTLLDREIPDSVVQKFASSLQVKTHYSLQERNYPNTIEESYRRNETMEFILTDLNITCWGYPRSNSGASNVLAEYFKEFNKRTVEMEQAHIQLSRDFLTQLVKEDPVWKQIVESEGKPWDEVSDFLKQRIYDQISGDVATVGFGSAEQATNFFKSAKVKRVRPTMHGFVYEMNSRGQIHQTGITF